MHGFRVGAGDEACGVSLFWIRFCGFKWHCRLTDFGLGRVQGLGGVCREGFLEEFRCFVFGLSDLAG